MAEYLIQGETLTGIADQVRRISGVDGELTPEQMTTNLLNVTKGSDLPSAEEWSFGVENAVEFGVTQMTKTPGKFSSSAYAFNKFTANQAFAIVGLRCYSASTMARCLRLWNSNREKVRQKENIAPTANEWCAVYFDEPFNVAVGETFYVSSDDTYTPSYISTSYITINEKVSFGGGASYSSNAVPDDARFNLSKTQIVGIVDILIGTISAALPNDYQITRNTMDDIAEEVQRITGTTNKMTTAQIITALQGVAVQSSE